MRKRFRNIKVALEMLTGLLNTLENRRAQLYSRSTVSLAASSGLLVLTIQFLFSITGMENYREYRIVLLPIIASMILSSLSIVTTLDLVKSISRKKNLKNKSLVSSNMFYFGNIAKKSEDEVASFLMNLSLVDKTLHEISQVISLSRNLAYRYKQLRKTRFLFVSGLFLYIHAIISFVVVRYDIIRFFLSGGEIC